jgi:amino acid transporter
MKKAKNILFISILFLGFSIQPDLAGDPSPTPDQQPSYWDMQVGMDVIGSSFGEEVGQVTDVRIRVVRIINVALTILGLLLVVLIIFAGFRWMTAGGNEDTVKNAQGILKNAIIGLIIIILAWSISRFILIRLEKITTNQPDYLNPQPNNQ